MGGNQEHRIGLDLLRALAILLVLIAHFGQRVLPADAVQHGLPLNILGHLGVELFFVLSGFLIGGLLLDICGRGVTVRDWRIFMARRAMRTIPAYVLCVLLLLALKPLDQARPYLIQYLSFTQNLAWPMPPTQWFAVSWSLAVEEWFYLLFSATLLGLATLFPRRGFAIAVAGFLVVPLAARVALVGDGDWDNDVRKVVLLRLDAIAYGVLLVRIMRSSDLLARHWLACLWTGLGLLAATAAVWCIAIGTWSGGGPAWRVLSFNVVSIALALLFPAAMRMRMRTGPLAAVVTGASALSYGMYLYHTMMLDWVRPFLKAGGAAAGVGLALAALATVAAAYLSYRYFERPILHRRPSHAPRQPVPQSGTALDRHLAPV